MRAAFEESPEFCRLLAGGAQVRLARVALEIARDAYPELDVAAYLNRIETLAERVRHRARPAARPREVLGHINWVLYVEEEMRGNQDDYYDPRNSYLNEVLDRRLGIPISLSILYSDVAERLGLGLAGVNFPMHFMLRMDAEGGPSFIDAFDGGTIRDRHACEQRLSELSGQPVLLTDALIAPSSAEMVVARMLRNLKAIYWNAQDLEAALHVQRRLAAIERHAPAELRDLATLCARLRRPGEAIDAFEAYLDAEPDATDASEIRALVDLMQREIARWN
jgi:regulator of sirC expression with transglutaminase-like and TPR domain